ncbi:hypothetical protein Q3A66_09390 [Hymenobacter sp. BT770]|jgi:hypothetical protein|uniref:hypothetical protein n=1 Tax=Hymenobacter sp. BT770 TaxID=2886942 RepID=UPI001D12D854|nr:hypothetical protein [Hymenobacter sp. BT770]MCC3152037.1 hypothetical protein [Hymenobacter sp. BT770]MDO3415280.1 hypothetical protein [Hymenobacter sp. BT770]
MSFLPRLLGLGLLSLLVFLMMSCESSKPASSSEFGSPNRIKGEAIAKPDSRQIVHFTDSTAEYKTSRSDLARAFIKQFGDGTVIDKVQVRKAPADADTPASYYLIGMGLRNGMFRAMALPLTGGGDNTYYLRPGAERYTITSVGCAACFFNFENGRIVGTTCSENSAGSHCDLKVETNNSLFAAR